MPIATEAPGPTNPEAGVIATSPATAPEANPSTLGLPLTSHSVNIHASAAAAAAIWVATMAMQIAAAAAALAWMFTEWLVKGKPSVLGLASGAVAGLVAITPASGFV